MSYQEKRSVVSIVSGILILAAYCIYAYAQFQAGALASDDIKAWAVTMLIFIGIGILAAIIVQIVFHILLSIGIAVKEKMKNGQYDDKTIDKKIQAEMVTDEMDKLIELKAMKVGFAIAGIGFVFALFTQLFNYSPAVMMNLMFLSFSAGSVIEGLTQIYYYRKGIKNA